MPEDLGAILLIQGKTTIQATYQMISSLISVNSKYLSKTVSTKPIVQLP
jgi:hypothetical protein